MLSKVEDAPMETDLSFEAETDGVLVRVSPQFVDEESSPERNHYVWAYHVEIENHGSRTLKLETRRWCITDRDGRVQDVEGPGVVGQHPVLEPGDRFEYTSGAPLAAPSGLMYGAYSLSDENGDIHDVQIPMFNLDSPYDLRRPS